MSKPSGRRKPCPNIAKLAEEMKPIVENLDLGDFMTMALGYLIDPATPPAIRDVFDEEGKKRAKVVADKDYHLAACMIAASACHPRTVVGFIAAGLKVHPDPDDEIRVLIIREFGKLTNLINQESLDALLEEELEREREEQAKEAEE